jgi:hypothetical protein
MVGPDFSRMCTFGVLEDARDEGAVPIDRVGLARRTKSGRVAAQALSSAQRLLEVLAACRSRDADRGDPAGRGLRESFTCGVRCRSVRLAEPASM